MIAPAGCGKTELIALAVELANDRQLILTHTHAGVRALRDRLKKRNVPLQRVWLDTIDGFALRFAHAFSSASGLGTASPPGVPWPDIRDAGIRALKLRAVRGILRRSFSGAYVDEYQDCTSLQHSLITIIDDTLGCRIVGDPLQGIFDFQKPRTQAVFDFYKEDQLADWSSEVQTHFPPLFELRIPWRWKNANPLLGEWLTDVRQRIARGEPLHFRNKALSWRPDEGPRCKNAAQVGVCHAVANAPGSVVAIHNQRNQCYYLGKKLNGRYTCVEPLECEELFEWASRIEVASDRRRALEVIAFTKECLTKVPHALSSVEKSLKEDRLPTPRQAKEHPELKEALTEVATTNSMRAVARAFVAIDAMPRVQFHRRELWQNMMRAVTEYDLVASATLRDVAWKTRDQRRRIGRPVGQRTLGTAYLIKGLEFCHAVVLDADALSAKELYVALTRGSASLHVLSKNSTIRVRL